MQGLRKNTACQDNLKRSNPGTVLGDDQDTAVIADPWSGQRTGKFYRSIARARALGHGQPATVTYVQQRYARPVWS